MHPTPEPDAAIIHRMNRVTAGIKDHPETYTSDTLWALLNSLTDLKKVLDNELVRRMTA